MKASETIMHRKVSEGGRPFVPRPLHGSAPTGNDSPRITICYPMAGDSLGGSHHSLLGLLRLLDQTKFRLLVVVEREGGRLAGHFDGFEIMADPAAPRRSFIPGRSFGPLKFLQTFSGLSSRVRFLRDQKVAIVHTNDGRTHASWAIATKIVGAKLLWHHRADPDARGLRFLAPLVADSIVTVSQFSLPRGRQTRAVREARVVFSPFPTDIVADRSAARRRLLEELGLPDNVVVCGYFGTFIERKRPLVFIDAIPRLRQMAGRPVVGLMFGEGGHPELVKKMQDRVVAQHLESCVKIMGYRSPGWEWIAGCDILLVPAVGEPLGRTLVEAMIVGTPVVATRSGGNPEAIGDDVGILVQPDDADALARGCAFVVNNPDETRAMTARAKTSAQERFADSRHVESIMTIYGELIGRPA